MRFVFFCHSLLSDWNHDSAHFLRGIVSELAARGHRVTVFEPVDAWSVQNLVHEEGPASLRLSAEEYPDVQPRRYDRATLDLDEALDGADVVLVHDWNTPDLISRIGAHRKRSRSRYTLVFHDTHPRAVVSPEAMDAYDLSGYDAVLGFCEAVRRAHERAGWARRSFVWYEAADIRVFKPWTNGASLARRTPTRTFAYGDVVWIENWRDDAPLSLRELLLEPVHDLRLRAQVFGVRYPDDAIDELATFGVRYGGWLPNFHVPRVFAAHTMTVQAPPAAEVLDGVPTIKMFEALACGVPLITAYWADHEGLFQAGLDYLVARSGTEMRANMRALMSDPAARAALSRRGRETILGRHTCAHRVEELFRILDSISGRSQSGLRTNEVVGDMP